MDDQTVPVLGIAAATVVVWIIAMWVKARRQRARGDVPQVRPRHVVAGIAGIGLAAALDAASRDAANALFVAVPLIALAGAAVSGWRAKRSSMPRA